MENLKKSLTGKRISIKAAKDVANQFGYTQVIITAFDKNTGTTSVCTYGKSQEDCVQAAQGGNFVKKALGWPESATNAKPSRQIRNDKMLEIIKGLVTIIEKPNSNDAINLAEFTGWAVIAKRLLVK